MCSFANSFSARSAPGVLAPGDQMPTMRQVAVALRVDLNTVRHAYDELERAGAIRLERGRGSFVADAPPTIDADARAAQTRQPGPADRSPWPRPRASIP